MPDDAGVRIAGNPDGDLTLALALADAPTDGDAVLDDEGARVFIDTAAEELLDGKILGAGADQQGNLQFSIAQTA